MSSESLGSKLRSHGSTASIAVALLVGALVVAPEPAAASDDPVRTIRPTSISNEIRPGDPSVVEAESIRQGHDEELDPSFYRPLPTPRPKPRDPDRGPSPAGNLVSFDLVSRVEQFLESNALLPEDFPEHGMPGSYGEETYRGDPLPPDVSPPSAPQKNFGALSLVTNVTDWPYRTAVKLFIEARDVGGTLRGFNCSGSLIDPMHVITAGHCVYFHEDDDGHVYDDWAEQIVVSPGYYNGYQPYGNARAVDLHAWTGWTEDENFDHDLAIIDLEEPIGALTGYLGYDWSDDCDYYKNGTWRHVGWPGEGPYSGEFPYEDTGIYDRCDLIGHELSFDRESFGGQSGSGAFRDNTVFAVLSNGNTFLTHDVRITDTKFGHIVNWIDDDTPSSADLMALDVHVNPTSVYSGGSLAELDYLVHNYSDESWSGTLSVSVRLSSNSDISTYDPEIQTHSFATTIGAKASLRVEMPGPTIPSDAPSATYYVGVILNLADSNNLNNDSDGDEAAQIEVICPDQASVSLVWPYSGSSCHVLDPVLDWSTPPNAASYELQIGTSCGSGSIYTTGASQMQVTLLPETTYFWRVRAQNPCGDWSPWTLCRYFTTGMDAPGTVPLTWPANGETCITTSPWLDWNSATGAVDYEVQIGTSCTNGPTYFASSSSYQVTGLDPNTVYYWRVRGLNSCGNPGSWSACRSFRTKPDVPGVVTLVDPSEDDDCVSLSPTLDWMDEPSAELYEVQIGVTCPVGAIHTTTSSQLALSGLAPDHLYRWRVRARNSCDEWGNWSVCQEFRTELPPPAAPVMTVPGDGDGCLGSTVTLQWDPVDNANNYSLRVGTACGAGTIHTAQETSYEITGLAPGTTYYWQVRTKDTCGTLGSWSECFTFQVDGTPPSVPQNLLAVPAPGVWTNDPFITVRWFRASDDCAFEGYSYLWTENRFLFPDTISEGPETEVESPKLPNGNLMRFVVRSVDAAGNGSASAAVGPFWIDTVAPAVTLVSPNGGESWHEGETHTIEWTASDATSGIDTIELRYSLDGGATYPHLIGNPDATDLSFDWEIPVVESDQAKVRIIVRDRATNQRIDASNTVFSLGPPVVGAPELPAVTSYALQPNYPNPFNPRTTIRYSLLHEDHVRLAIYNVQGELVRTLVNRVQAGPAWHEVSWNGDDDHGGAVASGVYFYQLVSGTFAETRRMILVR